MYRTVKTTDRPVAASGDTIFLIHFSWNFICLEIRSYRESCLFSFQASRMASRMAHLEKSLMNSCKMFTSHMDPLQIVEQITMAYGAILQGCNPAIKFFDFYICRLSGWLMFCLRLCDFKISQFSSLRYCALY